MRSSIRFSDLRAFFSRFSVSSAVPLCVFAVGAVLLSLVVTARADAARQARVEAKTATLRADAATTIQTVLAGRASFAQDVDALVPNVTDDVAYAGFLRAAALDASVVEANVSLQLSSARDMGDGIRAVPWGLHGTGSAGSVSKLQENLSELPFIVTINTVALEERETTGAGRITIQGEFFFRVENAS